MKLRDYQSVDVEAVIAAHQNHQAVLGWAATGLGKSIDIAALAQHYSPLGRIMVLADMGKLVRQLAGSIRAYMGIDPGVEMADEQASNGGLLSRKDRIVVSTVQTQYSGREGCERYRQFDPSEFSLLVLDEGETYFADNTSRSVVEWYRQNPNLRIFACTATPYRTDGIAAANLCSHVAFERDILWGIEQGWLVKCRQGFVHVSLDLSTLKLRKNAEGETDYSDSDIAEQINNDVTLVELSKGIIEVAGDRKSIVVCPDVATARAVADYICRQKPGSAQAIYGSMADESKSDIFDTHKAGDFQFLCSVMLLSKGYDDPAIRAVFNCRKTRSKRLYTQVLGRGTRPLAGTVDGLASPEDRKKAITESAKPDCLMVNLVGIRDEVRDMTVLDVLGHRDERVNLRAKQILAEDGGEMEDALATAEDELAMDDAASDLRAESEQERLDQMDLNEQISRSFQVDAQINVEWSDDLRVGAGEMPTGRYHGMGEYEPRREERATDKQVKFIAWKGREEGWTRESAAKLTKRQASGVIGKLMKGAMA